MADTTADSNNRAIVFKGRKPMPWTGKTFAARHNKKLSPGEAKSAARQASAIVEKGGDEGTAIAVANKRAAKLRKQGLISDRQHKKFTDKHADVDAATR